MNTANRKNNSSTSNGVMGISSRMELPNNPSFGIELLKNKKKGSIMMTEEEEFNKSDSDEEYEEDESESQILTPEELDEDDYGESLEFDIEDEYE
mmetsp:Transcript_28636/g.43248  ORF Transcript_28636/g.43248 Transcript_28636/m.43248 type:complete len:95 (+) Transcript_28636:2905-3189(+)|eukprot:CAMPEP_0170499838 /NCGR_PEP_ID=MMETSP0208-20121228/32814_1 /TAXON_ID=197538 /ORGANISM="Strombidium inclinatum, Strain S3" /LENGTH=94 /DNA_ID=CAMNT_0010777577 /DNA_START=2859 /DNA_END=3143 /DNA_ORIENTATION=+